MEMLPKLCNCPHLVFLSQRVQKCKSNIIKNLSTSGQISGNTEFTNVLIKFLEKNLSPACVTLPACSKIECQIERRLGITGEIPASTEFTNVIMKYQGKMQ